MGYFLHIYMKLLVGYQVSFEIHTWWYFVLLFLKFHLPSSYPHSGVKGHTQRIKKVALD